MKPPNDARPPWLREPVLLGGILALHASFYVYLILARRFPAEHDTLYSFVIQWLFQAYGMDEGAPALWLPAVTHGRVSNWEFASHCGFVQTVLLGFGGLPEGWNFLPWFYVSLWFDELILMVGVWCLGKRYALSPLGLFFTVLTAAGSSLWLDQMFFNLRLFHALPLVFALYHGFAEDGARWKLHAAINLLFMGFLGNSGYLAIFAGFVALLYGVTHALFYPSGVLGKLRPRLSDLPAILVNGATLAAAYALFRRGSETLALHRAGRGADGSVSLDDFVTYGSSVNPIRYADFLSGISPSLDYSLYVGAAALALAVSAIFCRPGRRVLHLAVCLLLLVLFGVGYLGVVSALSYTAAPPLRLFRVVAGGGTIARLLVILLAGIGFEAWRRGRVPAGAARRIGFAMVAAGVLMGAVGAATAWRTGLALSIREVLRTAQFRLGENLAAESGSYTVVMLAGSAVAAAAVGLLLRRRAGAAPAVLALLLVHAADLHRWKIQMTAVKTVQLATPQVPLQEIRRPAYHGRRDVETSERQAAMASLFPIRCNAGDTVDPYLGLEPPYTRRQVTHWEGPFDRLLRTYRHGIDPEGKRPDASWVERRPFFPVSVPAYDKLTGVTEDKLQVFGAAYRGADDRETGDVLNRPGFGGDLLLLASDADVPALEHAKPAASDRLAAVPEVLEARANRVRVRVEMPQEGWLYYADAWHPQWTATVNGAPAKVERAWIAYKAVKVGRGANVVEFRFRSPERVLAFRWMGAFAAGWIVAVLGIAARCVLPAGLGGALYFGNRGRAS
jgi:hypothetical protein